MNPAFSETRPALSSHLLLWLVLSFVAAALIWAYQAEIDEVTRGNGKVIPSSQVQIVQNLEGGIVAELLVEEGDTVEKDQVLLRIDDTRFASSFREGQLQTDALQAKILRLRAESRGEKFAVPKQTDAKALSFYQSEADLFKARANELQANLDVLTQQKRQREQELSESRSRTEQLRQSHALAVKELNITRPLVKQGVMSEIDLLRLQREVSDLKGELDAQRLSIPRIQAGLAELNQKAEEITLNFKTRALAELNEYEAQFSRQQESNLALEDRVTRTAVRSPVHGTVKRLMVTTLGGVVQPGMSLVEIVPLEDSLLVEARIRPADIAFLRPGQEAKVKFTAYDFAIFGGLAARLEHISADSITDERGESFFLIRVRTERNYLGTQENNLPVIPGMTVSVDILTGRKTILDYLLKPINRARERALRER